MHSRIKSSGLKTSDSIIKNSQGYFYGFSLVKEVAGQVIGTLYDNPSSASGTVISKIVIEVGERAESMITISPVWFKTGLFLDLSGTGAQAIVYFD